MELTEISIFLSSTFDKEMIKKRETFRLEITARLNGVAGQANASVFLKDFELGIPENTDNVKVIEICLDAILGANYFVGLVGQNRGTLVKDFVSLDKEKRSKYYNVIEFAIKNEMTVLELEFYVATVNHIKSFFFFDSNTDNFNIVSQLLKNNQYIKGYSCTNQLIEDVVNIFKADFILNCGDFLSETIQERNTNIIASNKMRYYIPNFDVLNQINNYLSKKTDKAFVLFGDKGSGKSTVLFDWLNSEETRIDDSKKYFYFPEYYHLYLEDFLYSVLCDMDCRNNTNYSIKYYDYHSEIKRIEYFRSVITNLDDEYFFIFDGIEKLKSHNNISPTHFIPFKLNEKTKMIVTSNILLNEKFFYIYKLNQFDSMAFIMNYFEKEGKILIYEKYKEKFSLLLGTYVSPLLIRLVLSEISITAKYDTIDKVLDDYISSAKNNDNPYCNYIFRLNHYFKQSGKEILRDVLLYLFLSQNGLDENDLIYLVGTNNVKYILNIMYFDLQKNDIDKFVVLNEYLRNAIEKEFVEGIDLASYLDDLLQLTKNKIYEHKEDKEIYSLLEEYLSLLDIKGNCEEELLNLFYQCDVLANLWYHNRNLVKAAFAKIQKKDVLINNWKEFIEKDNYSNAPFFMAHILSDFALHSEAVFFAKRCLERMKNNPITFTEELLATQYSNLALYMFYSGDDNYANEIEEYLHISYKLRKNSSQDVDSLCESCNNLSMFYETRDVVKARMFMDESLAIAKNYYADDSDKLIDIYIQNSSLLTIEGKFNVAHEFLQMAYSICKKIYGQDSLPYARITICESHTFKMEKKDNEIISILPRSINIYKLHNIENEDLVVAYKYYLQALVNTKATFDIVNEIIHEFYDLLLRLNNDYYTEDLNVLLKSAEIYNIKL